MAWGLDLYDLKIIANNSIKYSSIPHELKKVGYEKFENQWQKFIDQAYTSVCFKARARWYSFNINVSNILPSFGPANKQVELRIFGIGFEKAICQKIACLFNDIKTEANMIGIGEIQCKTPILNLNSSESFKSATRIVPCEEVLLRRLLLYEYSIMQCKK
ncbi:adenosine deaminase CECR1-like [Brachionus plicatilis]|uniref:Adenosine deaminase CECR1-like n=1 Tax=Brachionus plicatilis TaxID=10195 RepID=A0A3M7P782_BRAPC|nr:adenosine deaminase CECR1-like [Brachionus plicatilis]